MTQEERTLALEKKVAEPEVQVQTRPDTVIIEVTKERVDVPEAEVEALIKTVIEIKGPGVHRCKEGLAKLLSSL